MRTAAILLALAAGASACRSVDVRSPFASRDELGNLTQVEKADEKPGAWRYRVDSGRLPGPAPTPSDPHPGGLRVAVTAEPGLPGDADAHEVYERVAFDVPVGRRAVWTGRPYASPAAVDPMWVGAEVGVVWAVVLESRTDCAVLVDAVPVLIHQSGCRAALVDLRVRRVLSLDEALVLAVDPSDPAASQAAVLVGSRDGETGRFILRVRS
jgi:hypothetical protein